MTVVASPFVKHKVSLALTLPSHCAFGYLSGQHTGLKLGLPEQLAPGQGLPTAIDSKVEMKNKELKIPNNKIILYITIYPPLSLNTL